MNHRRIQAIWSATILAVALISMPLLQIGAVRLLGAAAFCLIVPGSGWARRMRSNDGDGGDILAMSVIFSICATTLVGTAMAVYGRWSPLAGFGVLMLITVAGFLPFRRGSATRIQAKSISVTKTREIRKAPVSPWDSFSGARHADHHERPK